MSKFLFYFLFFSLNCKAPLNHWEMALNKFIIIIIIIPFSLHFWEAEVLSNYHAKFYLKIRTGNQVI